MGSKAGSPEGARDATVLLPPLAVLQGRAGLARETVPEATTPTGKRGPSSEGGRVLWGALT